MRIPAAALQALLVCPNEGAFEQRPNVCTALTGDLVRKLELESDRRMSDLSDAILGGVGSPF